MSPTEHNGVINDHASISFREVVETHKRALYFLSLDLTGNHHDAEVVPRSFYQSPQRTT
jgi:hypothetical protein